MDTSTAARANEHKSRIQDFSPADAEDEDYLDTPEPPPVSDRERVEWCLRYGLAQRLGVVTVVEYIPLTLELIDGAILREKQKAARR